MGLSASIACTRFGQAYLKSGDGCGSTRPSHLAFLLELLLFGTHDYCGYGGNEIIISVRWRVRDAGDARSRGESRVVIATHLSANASARDYYQSPLPARSRQLQGYHKRGPKVCASCVIISSRESQILQSIFHLQTVFVGLFFKKNHERGKVCCSTFIFKFT